MEKSVKPQRYGGVLVSPDIVEANSELGKGATIRAVFVGVQVEVSGASV